MLKLYIVTLAVGLEISQRVEVRSDVRLMPKHKYKVYKYKMLIIV